jgi:uncharacterized protein
MKLHLETGGARYQITAYRTGEVTVNGQALTGSIVVSDSELIRDWPPRRLEEIEASHLEAILRLQPELVILGSGPHQRFPEPTRLVPLLAAGIGVEVMDTGAACRTFNILVAEGRRVVAALLSGED